MSVVCTFSSCYSYFLISDLRPFPPLSLSPSLFAELWFLDSLFPVFLSFHRCHSFFVFFFSRKIRKLFSDSAVTYGDTTSNECDRAIKHSNKKGARTRRTLTNRFAKSDSSASARSSSSPSLLSRLSSDQERRRSRQSFDFARRRVA